MVSTLVPVCSSSRESREGGERGSSEVETAEWCARRLGAGFFFKRPARGWTISFQAPSPGVDDSLSRARPAGGRFVFSFFENGPGGWSLLFGRKLWPTDIQLALKG